MADKSLQIIILAGVFLLLTWIAVGLRVYCRMFLVRSVGKDDKVMMVLLLLFTVYLGLQIYGGILGIGLPDSELSPQRKLQSLRLWWILELLNVCSTCLLKISVGYFLLRVAIDRPHIWIIWVLMAGTVIFGITYLLMVTFQCRPVATYWEEGPRTPDKCWPRQVIYIMTIAATVINTSADFIFGTLPWFIVRSMNLPLGTKIVVVAILGFAAIGSTATIVRAFYIPTLLEERNFLYETTNFAIWSTVEPGVGTIAASVATLRPLYHLVVSRISRTNSSGQRRDQWRQRQQAGRHETSRDVRAHHLDVEDPPEDSDLTHPHGILEVNPPALDPVSKNTESTTKSRSTDCDTTQRTLTLMKLPSALRLSEDFRRTMDRPSEEWMARIRAEEEAGGSAEDDIRPSSQDY
ncbi:hypothetical protein CkaCkLH20_13211 [Colletotrichum karsti]|uniref:Rhodopsin domain-containing protein n=1 Tax=Colletotrichum karsti TaxID=1095194 RepID=A0A9P6LCN2_9PEZI|nr:uncharacterized protein CkaCkLH20_13211 [Colletotrichum karsti]KAF9869294.1 hypothetical protein CkaCkLH20_13211 [Colletotrichum karsti]